MIVERRTLSEKVSLSGRGLHSGEPVTVTIFPNDNGIRFRVGSEEVEANPHHVTDTSRCTVLGSVRTVEHLMSALAAHKITDALVELSYPEVPGLDGSSKEWYSLLGECRFDELSSIELNDIYTRLYVHADDIKVAVGKGQGHWRFDFVTGERWPGEMSFDCPDVMAAYAVEIAPARTTVFSEEIELAKAAGLGRGLDESSVLILGSQGYENEARFDNEPARHKLLDLIGDLYLAGVPIDHLNVVATKSGHRRNVEMAKLLYDTTRWK